MSYVFNPFTGNFDLDPSSQLTARLDAFRDSRRIYVSKDGNDSNNGTSLGEPLLTLSAAAALAEPGDLVEVGPGVYTESSLPIRWKRDVGVFGRGLRNVIIRGASGQEYNDIFHVDSGFWAWGIQFAGHQANALTGQQAWAISFDALADNRAIGAVSLGAFIFKSPYVQNCSSITAEDDEGLAGSSSTGDTGGGILIDGSRCALNSPIRSMVVDSYTQVNLGGPGCLVKNDGYAQLVSFFGTFCEYHVKASSGGQVNLSGGGTTDFGTYGLIADGYSPSPVFTGKARVPYFGAPRIEKSVTIDTSTDTFSSTDHGLVENDQITFKVSNGVLPIELNTFTTYYVIASGLTSSTFKVSETQGGSPLDLTGAATGTYQFVRQGVTQIDVIDFDANRLGRQIKYPSVGSAGSTGNPVTISSVNGNSFTVTLGVSSILHTYVGGGTLVVGSTNYPIKSASYNNLTGVTTLVANGYTPVNGESVTLSGLSFICNSISRPNSGQLMFPQLVFPRNATSGSPESKSFTYTRTGDKTLTFTEAAAPSGPDHEYVSGGTVVIGGNDLGVVNAVYNKDTGVVTITTQQSVPAPSGTVTVEGFNFICPTSAYVVTGSIPINSSGVEVPNSDPSRVGYRVLFYSTTNGGLLNPLAISQTLDFRNRSQVSAPGHTFEFVGSGTNYDALPSNGGVPNPANKIVEINNGRVFSSNTDELGNFSVGTQFAVDGTTGSVTINTNQFNLTGLNFIGPFSRNGGISTVGVQLRELSNNTSLLASTGAPDGNTAPTQFAVKTFTTNTFLAGLTVTAGQPITLSDTSVQDSNGFWSRSRNIDLSLNQANGLVRLDGSGLVPAAYLPSYVDDVIEVDNFAALPVTGETGKIYVTKNDGKTFRWTGSTYIEISNTGTDLSYTASTRLLASSTGADVTLPLFATDGTNAGLVPGSSTGGTTNFLRADGTWAYPIPDPLTVNNLTVNTLLTAAHIHGSIAGSLYIHVKNTSGGVLTKGTPVFATGTVGDTATLEVAAADAANGDKIPAIGILNETLDNNGSGHVVMFGEITGVNTAGYQVNDELYLKTGGGLTATKPTSGYTQSLAIVGRVHSTTGTLLVWVASGSEAPPVLATVATTGAYSDLSGLPTLGTFAAANAATPPAIGGTTPAAGAFTNLSASVEMTLPNGSPANPTYGDIYTVSNTVRYRDASATERLLLNAADNLANLANAATARSNLGAAASGSITGSGLTMATARLLGRTTAGDGAIEVIQVVGGTLSGGILTITSGGGGMNGVAASLTF